MPAHYPGGARPPTVFLTADDVHFTPFRRFDGPALLTKFKSTASPAEMSQPFVIMEHSDLQAVLGDRMIQSAMGIFQVQFRSSEQGKINGRGTLPLMCAKKDLLRQCLLECAPMQDNIPAAKENEFLVKMISAAAQWFILPSCVTNGEVDRQGMPSIRYQSKGTRQVCVVSWDKLEDHLAQVIGSEGGRLRKDLLETMTAVFEKMTIEDLEKLTALGRAALVSAVS